MKQFWDDLSDEDKSNLAASLNTSEDYLRQVFNGYRRVSPLRAKDIESKTDGKVSRHDLRPDIFDAPQFQNTEQSA